MYWNNLVTKSSSLAATINRNMRCIEIKSGCPSLPQSKRLIETWDVLKFPGGHAIHMRLSGLIETWDVLKSQMAVVGVCEEEINRNMRCIEMLTDLNKIVEI